MYQVTAKIDYLLIALVEFVNFINYMIALKYTRLLFCQLRMDLLESYNSGSSSSDSEECELGRREIRKVYLITYSQANTSKIPTRNSFAEAVMNAFKSGSASVLHWCCSQESHKKSGVHYHMCLKLDRNHRWLRAKKYLSEQYGISVHFSSVHTNYYTARKYVTKEDQHCVESEGHPDLN